MGDHLASTDLRKDKEGSVRDGKATLRERETILSALAFQAWEPWLFGMRFAASEEGFHRQINAHCDILQHLGMHTLKRGTLLFQDRKGRLLPVERKTFASLLIRCPCALRASGCRANDTLQGSHGALFPASSLEKSDTETSYAYLYASTSRSSVKSSCRLRRAAIHPQG
jgi:hypothetical protein